MRCHEPNAQTIICNVATGLSEAPSDETPSTLSEPPSDETLSMLSEAPGDETPSRAALLDTAELALNAYIYIHICMHACMCMYVVSMGFEQLDTAYLGALDCTAAERTVVVVDAP